MILNLTCIVLLIVGAMMTFKPMTYWQIGHMMKPDAEEPGTMYLRMIRISGVIVLLIAIVLGVLGMMPSVTGQTVTVSGGENWEYAFTADNGMAQLHTVPADPAAEPYDVVTDGEYIYFLGKADGQAGLYRTPAAGKDAGKAELLAALNEGNYEYENLQYEEGKLIWLQQLLDSESTAVYVLHLEGSGEPALLCTLLEPVERYLYHENKLYWTDGDEKRASLVYWDGVDTWKLVGGTYSSEYPLSMEDGWIGTVTDKRTAVTRVNMDQEDEMKLEVTMKGVDGVWTSEECTLIASQSGQVAAVMLDGKDASQYVLKEKSDAGLLQLAEGQIWQLEGIQLTVYDVETLKMQELNVPAGTITEMAAAPDGTAVLWDAENRMFHVGTLK